MAAERANYRTMGQKGKESEIRLIHENWGLDTWKVRKARHSTEIQ